MEMLQSLCAQFRNRGILKQARMRAIHEGLLRCLEETDGTTGRYDYQPGIVELSQQFSFSIFGMLLRLRVSRNGVDIFPKGGIFPEMKLIREMGDKYILIQGVRYELFGEKRHVLYRYIPQMLIQFADSSMRQPGNGHIQYSRIS